MNYVGEHLLPGQIGHFFLIFSFAASFVATVAYYKATVAKDQESEASWKHMARIAFRLNALAVLGIFLTIIFIISNHYFEYNYAWEHSSKSLPPQYLLACIWEAQEGSFLLWIIWQCILGLVLIRTSKKWEASVMTIMSFGQLCLASMIIGIYVYNIKIGINPFLLVRQMEGFFNAPIFNSADYLKIPQMQDGQGFNSLLQNYWVVIHPPILFLGFASSIVPFAYAMAGIWKKDYSGWIKAALPWTLFATCVLGTGVMMGAAWAYEALSFGGFWSWDPVENASFVPWLVLVAGLHTQLAYRSTGHSLRATYFFLITSFVLVLYATFLTRSGILGDASVHAFVDSGMNLQLELFIAVFMLPSYFLFIWNYSKIPHIEKEEGAYSREFWMFIGSLVLFLSSLFIIIATSLPVFNKILGTKWSVGEDNTFAYNRIEIFIAILLGVLTAITQYLKYKDTDKKIFFRHLAIPTTVGIIASILVSIFGNIHFDRYGTGYLIAIHIGLFAGIYSAVANAMYIWTGMNGKLKSAGASIAHVGFGIMLIGILLSTSKKELLSYNTTGINLPFDPKNMDKNPLENITLLRNVRTDMGRYWATYTGEDSTNGTGNINYYHIRLQDKKSGELFELYPNLIKATKGMEGVSQNPDKHHYWDRDIFSYIQYASNLEKQSDTSQFRFYPISEKDTVFYSNGYLLLDKTVRNPDNDKYHFNSADTALMADVLIMSRDSMKYHARPLIYVKDDRLFTVPDTVFTQNLIVVLKGVEEGKPQIGIRESSSIVPFVSLKAYVFPQINLLWLGTLIMISGFVMSILRRIRTSRI